MDSLHSKSSLVVCENCDPDILHEKWLSVIHHVTNRHYRPGNKHFHKCEHDRLTPEQQRKKKRLIPSSAAHAAFVTIVKDESLLKDLAHLTQFVYTTGLDVYHSLYRKHLPNEPTIVRMSRRCQLWLQLLITTLMLTDLT